MYYRGKIIQNQPHPQPHKNRERKIFKEFFAQVAELVDALDSKSSVP